MPCALPWSVERKRHGASRYSQHKKDNAAHEKGLPENKRAK
jgi:hypothetical protein